MIIGIEASSLNSKHTGTNRYLTCLIEQLEKTGSSIQKFQPYDQSTRKNISGKLRRNWYRNFSLAGDIEKSNVDCMIFPDYYMPSDVNKRAAVIIHDLSFISHPWFYSKSFAAYYNFLIRKTLKQNPVVVTISEHSKKNINKYLNVKEEDILIVQGYSTFGAEEKLITSKPKNFQPYLLYVGHIEPRKNLTFLVEGFLKWKEKTKSDFKLKLTGELWIKSPSTNSLVKNYLRHPDIEFSGYLSEDNLKEMYANASGFVHSSFEEGFGFPVLEAMHYGLPVLCSKDIATEEISKPYSVAIDPADIDSYVNGLDKLNELIYSGVHTGYEIKYSPELMSQQLDVLLERLGHKNVFAVNLPQASTKDEALEKTLIYSGLFNSGIKEEKLHRQLFDIKMTENELKQTIQRFIVEEKASWKDDYLYLNAGKGFYKRPTRVVEIKKIKKILRFLNSLPLVSMIAFSGGTANYGIASHDDIDLFIITKPNSVYMVYLMIHVYSILIGARKQLCANYLIDETNMKINYSFDFYTAHQIITLSAYKNSQMLGKFWDENTWVKDFFPNFNYTPSSINLNKKSLKVYSLLKPVNFLINIFYRKLYSRQLKLAKDRKSLIIKTNCLKLHTNDHRQKITAEFENALLKFYLNKKIVSDELPEQKVLVV